MVLDPVYYPREGDILDANGQTVKPEGATPGPTPAPNSPEWWRDRLVARLVVQSTRCKAYSDFFDGVQPLAFASQKFMQTYGARFTQFPANFMPLVVDAERERLIIDGFRFGTSPDKDKGVWKIWQQNQMDAESQIAHEIALTKGLAFAAIDPLVTDEVVITIEDPAEVVVITAPGSRRKRLAAAKVVTMDDAKVRAYVYLPDAIYVYESDRPQTLGAGAGLSQTRWLLLSEDPNRLGVVPIVPLVNRPRRDGTGRSEIEPVMSNQLAINFLRYAALIGSDTAALPQRWAKNLDVQIDDATGKPKEPFRTGRDTLWVTGRPTAEEVAEYGDKFPDVDFGQFPAASLDPFVSMIREEVGIMASNSRTPYHYLLGEPTSVPPSGESLKSSEAPLVKKVNAQAIHFGEAWEELMRVALVADGKPAKAAKATDAETIWHDPETRNEAQRTDSVLKQYVQGLLPDAFALEELGYSPQQIDRIQQMKADEEAKKAAAPPPAPPTIDPATGEPVQPPVDATGAPTAPPDKIPTKLPI